MLTKLKNFKQQKSQQGFTIIEVMIVLAIAGLILLIVFLAVPSLQRSSRNTQRKNDVSAVAAAVANYINNNGGQLPSAVNPDTANGVLEICGSSCTGTGNKETAKIGYYDLNTAANFTIQTSTTVTANQDRIYIIKNRACNSTNTDVSASTVSRTAAVIYWTETGSGTAKQCVEQ